MAIGVGQAYKVSMRKLFLPLICSVIALSACDGTESPEAAVRSVIAQMEAAAEARDVGDLLEHIAGDYSDAHGHTRDDLGRYVRGYFIANQSIHLLTRVQSIEFPSRAEARAQIQVGMLGREAPAADAWNLALDVHDFDVSLVRDSGKWKVSYARWR